MLDKELVQQRLTRARALREEYAAHVFRFEGAIVALEELLASSDQPQIVDTPEGPALDMDPFVDELTPVGRDNDGDRNA